MSNPLNSLMADFARAIGVHEIVVPESGIVTLRLADRMDVNVSYDASTHRVHVYSIQGEYSEFPQGEPLPGWSEQGPNDEWSSTGREANGFQWATHWHNPSGVTISSASSAAETLDSSRFCRLIEAFAELDRTSA
jgi:hypothetical protein